MIEDPYASRPSPQQIAQFTERQQEVGIAQSVKITTTPIATYAIAAKPQRMSDRTRIPSLFSFSFISPHNPLVLLPVDGSAKYVKITTMPYEQCAISAASPRDPLARPNKQQHKEVCFLSTRIQESHQSQKEIGSVNPAIMTTSHIELCAIDVGLHDRMFLLDISNTPLCTQRGRKKQYQLEVPSMPQRQLPSSCSLQPMSSPPLPTPVLTQPFFDLGFYCFDLMLYRRGFGHGPHTGEWICMHCKNNNYAYRYFY